MLDRAGPGPRSSASGSPSSSTTSTTRIKTPEDVRKHLGVPLLGVIPELSARRSGRRDHGMPSGPRDPVRSRATGCCARRSTTPGPSRRSRASCRDLDGARRGQDADLRQPGADPRLPGRKGAAHRLRPAQARRPTASCAGGSARASRTCWSARRSPPTRSSRPTGTTLSLLPAGTRVPSPADLLTAAMRGFLGACAASTTGS